MHQTTLHTQQASDELQVHSTQIAVPVEEEYNFANLAKITALHFIDSEM